MNRCRLWLLFSVLVWGRGCPAAQAYYLSGYQWDQLQLGDPVVITYSYSNLLDGSLLDSLDQPAPATVIRQSVEGAFSLWAKHAPLHFVEVQDGGPQNNPLVGNIRLGYFPIDGLGNIKGRAWYPTGTPWGGDVQLDIGDRWNLEGSFVYPDILGAMIHELGHSLGLLHSSESSANMWHIFPRFSGPGTEHLHEDDIAGIQAIYGVGVGSVTPLPEPSSCVLALLALGVAMWFYHCENLDDGTKKNF